jgi:hypothetical protein
LKNDVNVASKSNMQKTGRCGMFILGPDFYPSRLQDPTTEGKKFVLPFFVAINITTMKIILFLNR